MGRDPRGEPAGRPGFRPAHPGRIVKLNIEALGITIEDFAKHIDVSRQTVHNIMAQRSAVTPDMAARLGRAFNTSADLWLGMQVAHDVWGPERNPGIRRIRPFKRTVKPHADATRKRAPGASTDKGRKRRQGLEVLR